MTYGYQAGYRPPNASGGQQRPNPYIVPQQQPPRRVTNNGNGGGYGGGGGRPPQMPPQPPRPKKKKSKKGLISFLFILLVLAGAVGGSYYYMLQREVGTGDVFYQGVSIGNVDVSGMTPEQASTTLSNYENSQLSGWHVVLKLDDKSQTIGAGDINLHMNMQDQLQSAWEVGRIGTLLERVEEIRQVRQNGYQASSGIFYDESRIESILNDIKLGLDTEPESATSSFNPSSEQPLQYTQEVYGRALSIEPIKEQIVQSIVALTPIEVNLAEYFVAIVPDQTVESIQKGVSHIVTVRTEINPSSTDNRNENVRVALERLNGLQLVVGEQLSFNKVAKRRTPENGYQEALEIQYGEYVMGYGGGVCQVSTTLYQAVMRAGLEVVERKPHAQPPNYCEKAQDATVADDKTDFVFKNSTGGPLHITGRIVNGDNGKPKYCEISFYGIPPSEEFTYQLESKLVEEVPIPDEPIVKRDKEQEYVTYVGEEKVVDKGRKGYKVALYRLKMKDGMEVEREFIHEDYYKEKAPTVYVGTQNKD